MKFSTTRRLTREELRSVEARIRETNNSLSEHQFLAQVRQIATWTGWMIYHTHNSLHSPAGFPDLVLCRAPRLIFVELKSDRGKVRTEQTFWLDELGGISSVETYVWRPSDLDEIGRILARA